MVFDNVVDNQKELDKLIDRESGTPEEEGRITVTNHLEVVHSLNLGDSVTTCDGGASFIRDDSYFGLHHFDISLGPANSKRLIEFLLALPDEPDEG
jgi:hypothetical protein